jgi:hypothetical protein
MSATFTFFAASLKVRSGPCFVTRRVKPSLASSAACFASSAVCLASSAVCFASAAVGGGFDSSAAGVGCCGDGCGCCARAPAAHAPSTSAAAVRRSTRPGPFAFISLLSKIRVCLSVWRRRRWNNARGETGNRRRRIIRKWRETAKRHAP